jgi:hypothetical protein
MRILGIGAVEVAFLLFATAILLMLIGSIMVSLRR